MSLSKFGCQKRQSTRKMEKSFVRHVGKSPELFMVEKLWALLLLEEDFNTLCKINVNGRHVSSLEDLSTMPKDIIGDIRS